MPTRNVVVTDAQAEFIERMVGEGRYQNASELLREGLRLVEQRIAEAAARLEALRAAVDVGLAASERGDYEEFASFGDLDAYLSDLGTEAIRKAAAKA